MEIIQAIIRGIVFVAEENDWEHEGVIIKTSKQQIKLGIDNEQICCEEFGYFMSEDDPDVFIGAVLKSITITDTELKTYEILKDKEFEYGGGVMFVNIETDKGILQFVAYNAHLGYYGHSACVISNQLNHIETL